MSQEIQTYMFLIAGSAVIVLSYVFDLLAKMIRIPSVLMILSMGVACSFAAAHWSLELPVPAAMLPILGTLGLILIVLEGSLDLHLSRNQLPVIRRSLASAFFVLLLTSLLIAWILMVLLEVPFLTALVNAVPLGVVSSAIAVPSVVNLNREKKNFIIYESTFSDILGIMFFNFVAFSADFSAGSLVRLGVDIAVISVIALVSCLLLMFFLEKSTHHVKFMLVLAVLVISYSLGKLYHLSTLLLIFVMGLFINNTDLFIRGRFQRWFNTSKLNIQIDLLKNVTAELAFFVRTFFFLIFGFSIHLATLADPSVILVGILILGSVLLVRYAYLRTLIGGRIMPELFIAPRGLITILLFYSIPVHHRIVNFSSGILFFVIVTSTILMSVALMATRSKELTEELLQETG